MAKSDKSPERSAKTVVSDADKARARQWFAKAADCRERREYDYAIECFLKGLDFWPEAVDDGHMPLRSVAIQRLQAGGKKPGLMDGLKKPMSGKDAKLALFNAEHLLSLDPQNSTYAEGLFKNAIRGGFLDVAKWAAGIVYENLRKEKKLNKARFRAFRDAAVEAAEQADARGESALGTWMLEQAVQSLEYLVARTPTDEDLRNEQRDLSGKLTISRGKYEHAEDFRDSLQDADKQKLLHDGDRVKQAEDTQDALIAAARKEWEASPDVPARVTAYAETLLKTEQRTCEDEAIRVLTGAFEKSRNYSFKLRADDVRLRQLARAARALSGKARETGAEDDQQQARLAALEQREVSLEVYRERIAKYPTDLRFKFRLGETLFEAGEYDAAIPLLQAATADPRSRARAQLLIGRAFLERGNSTQAGEVLREALSQYEIPDELGSRLLYWLGRACETAGNQEEAKAVYGRLLRQDYNYMDGEVRKRLENLK